MMCNDYESHIRYAEYRDMMQKLALEVPVYESELALPQADDVKIGDTAAVMLSEKAGIVGLAPMKFGFPPSGKGGPVFNFRSEGRHFAESGDASSRHPPSSSSLARSILKPNTASP